MLSVNQQRIYISLRLKQSDEYNRLLVLEIANWSKMIQVKTVIYFYISSLTVLGFLYQ